MMSGEINMIKTKITILFVLTSIFCVMIGYWLGFTYGSASLAPHEKAQKNDNLAIGDTATIHHVEVTYHHVRTVPHLEDGSQQYVIVDLSITNKREQAYEINLHKFTLIDQNHYSYGYELFEDSKGILGGQIRSGRTVRGELAFLVPVDDKYELVFTDHLRTGQAVWTVEP